ncbi:beta-lactamase domain protein [Methylocella silvestris BL2]|uniref:Beta-lactamase domain protein n=1 Tax=Methylocella silvestris (strain DSM 15510 / CIP 108128 / LMG 27833 / NCIMB 13906 / BL2) TaxID=395965 RepID=B8ELQ9_METSB|nr:MBL fold metallo-hydrolase [Methylocella silvestris]ACK50053.1 beta-lactamase domain protein [Methylocella silvestris BL2]
MSEAEPAASEALAFNRAFDATAGTLEILSPLVRRIVADNPGPMTFTGTCAYIVGAGEVAIIDPGPASESHLAALADALRGEKIAAILVTHTHKDHSPGARLLQAATGAPILGCAPYAETAGSGSHDLLYAPDRILRDGDRFEGDGFSLVCVETPGHTSNHLAFALPQEQALFSGDHVMAWSTTVVIPPDGSMRDYMNSLDRLRQRDDRIYWPGHGGPVSEPQRFVRALAHHRRQREQAILSRLEKGDATVEAIVANVYENLPEKLRFAAGLSTLAHLQDLSDRGLVAFESATTTLSSRFRLA